MADLQTMNLGITVDDGSRRVPILNKQGEELGSFSFRPTDIGIIERFNALAGQFDAILEPLDALDASEGDGDWMGEAKYADAMGEARRRLCAAVDALFDAEGAAAAFFGRMNPFSPVEGELYCSQVLSALGAYISQQFDRETAAFSANAKKYARKATRK